MSSLIVGSLMLLVYLALLIFAVAWMDRRYSKEKRARERSERKHKLLEEENAALRKTNAGMEILFLQLIEKMNKHIHGEKVK